MRPLRDLRSHGDFENPNRYDRLSESVKVWGKQERIESHHDVDKMGGLWGALEVSIANIHDLVTVI